MTGAAATLTLLTAEEVVAKQPCSTHPNPRPGDNCIPSSSGATLEIESTTGPEVFRSDTIYYGDGTDSGAGN